MASTPAHRAGLFTAAALCSIAQKCAYSALSVNFMNTAYAFIPFYENWSPRKVKNNNNKYFLGIVGVAASNHVSGSSAAPPKNGPFTSRHGSSNVRAFHARACAKENTIEHDETSMYTPPQQNGGNLPPNYPHLSSLLPALSAVRKACRLTSHLQPTTSTSSISGLNKKDSTPVTIGDFAAQALVLRVLHGNFPDDEFIAEEGSAAMEEKDDVDVDGSSSSLAIEILNVLDVCGYQKWIRDVDELKWSIDLGQTYSQDGRVNASTGIDNKTTPKIRSAESTKKRVWCLDPIDGTRGFLRGKREGGQYCVALTLIEDGIPVVGILGCPNLPTLPHDDEKYTYVWGEDETEENNSESRGCIFVASKSGGCFQLPLFPPSDIDSNHLLNNDIDTSTKGAKQVHATKNTSPLSQARFCIGVEKYSDPLNQISAIAQILHGKLDSNGEILHACRMDSQVKYGVLARGGAEVYLRLPKEGYVEWIWDHAAGKLVVEEAGGLQTDTSGNSIDYSLGAKMHEDVRGVVATCGGSFHEEVLRAYKDQSVARKSEESSQ